MLDEELGAAVGAEQTVAFLNMGQRPQAELSAREYDDSCRIR